MKYTFLSLVFVMIASVSLLAQETVDKVTADETGSAKNTVAAKSTVSHLIPSPAVRPVADKVDAPKRSSANSSEWHYEITPYGWLSGIEGNLRVRNTTVRVESSAGDITDSLDFAFGTRFEMTKGKIGLHIDENYVNLGTAGVLNGPAMTPYDVQPTQNIFEIGPAYTLYAVPNENTSYPDKFSVEALGGMRWYHLGLGLRAGTASAEGSRNIIDGFGGVRFKYRPHHAITLSTKGTIGGGGSSFAWSANGLVDFRFHRNLSFVAGYQVLDMDADDPSNAVGFNGRLKGIILGLTFYR